MMPAPTLPLAPMPATVRPFTLASSPAEGPEGRKVAEVADNVLLHWFDRAEVLLASDALDDLDDLEYVPVPPNRVFFVTTRFVHVGKGTPRAITLDDE